MHSGKGTLALRSGRAIEVAYQFGSAFDDIRAGYLVCDVSEVDPAEFLHALRLTCQDGSTVELAIEHCTDRNLIVIGRVILKNSNAS